MSSDGTSQGREELEELGHDAIVAHQTEAHLPQKRARITEEAISVVISEPTASAEPLTPPPEDESTLTHGEATLVLGDRKDIEAARRKILARRRGAKGRGGIVWATLALALVAGGVLVFLGLRTGVSDRVIGDAAAPMAKDARATLPGAASAGPAFAGERPPRKVSLEELPVEPARPQR